MRFLLIRLDFMGCKERMRGIVCLNCVCLDSSGIAFLTGFFGIGECISQATSVT